MKCEASQELVVGGFTDPQGARVGLGALLVGYYDGDDFVFAGKIGTGFDTKLLLDLRKRLDALEIPKTPFTSREGPAAPARALGAHRRSSCRLSFIEWTGNNKLRHPRLIGVRFDKSAREVVREIVITHPEKIMFPDDGITKGDLAAYYEAIGAGDPAAHQRAVRSRWSATPPASARRASGRRTSRRAFPTGSSASRCPKKDGVVHHPVITDERSLLWVTNQNTITQHVWMSRVPDLYYPDICVFDLDPSTDDAGGAARGRARPARPARRARAAVVGEDLRLEGLSHRRAARRQVEDGRRRAIREHGRPRRSCRTRPDHLTQEFSQGRSRRAHLRRYRTQRLQRDVRRGLRRAREGRRAGVGAVHVGGDREAARSAPDTFNAAQHAGAHQEGRRPVGRHAAQAAVAEEADREAEANDIRPTG